MKKVKVYMFLGILLSAFLFQGCVDRDRKHYNTFENTGVDIYPIGKDEKGNNVFVKGVNLIVGKDKMTKDTIIQTLYVYCDEDGNLLGSGPITFNDQKGKHQETISVQ